MTEQLKKELSEEIRKKVFELYPNHIDGEVGVGKFRMTIHRIYEAGDGWMMGGTSYYAIIEVMNRLVKISRSPKWENWAYHYECGGSSQLRTDHLFDHKVEAYNHAQALRESGDLYKSLR